jgi:hypothetical protein
MDVKHRMIVFDAADIDAESAFWAGLLGGAVVEDGTAGATSGSMASGN